MERHIDNPRDLIGYGKNPPNPQWPNGARVALQFVVNYEEGGENCILHGDTASEAFLSEIVGAPALEGVRNMNMESIYEYGARAGFWRLHRMFTERDMPVTVYGVATALQRNPEIVAAMNAADWEIASHGLKWIDYQYVDKEVERQHIAEAIRIHTEVTGKRPQGWYTGRMSPNTRDLVAEAGGFAYDADSYADDLPYWNYDYEQPHLIVPYTLDSNDMRFATNQGFNCGDQFYQSITSRGRDINLHRGRVDRVRSVGPEYTVDGLRHAHCRCEIRSSQTNRERLIRGEVKWQFFGHYST